MFDGECLVIGEVAQAHDGSLGYAHAHIDAIARAGAGAVKFQTHIARYESSEAEPWRVKFSPQDDSRYDYWRRMEFSEDQWAGLKRHAEDKGLLFLSSPFSVEAVDLLERLGVKAWKIASGELTNPPLIARVLDTHKPVILSTGMAVLAEVDAIIAALDAHSNPDYAILQCTSKYPVAPEEIGLNMLGVYYQRYDCAVGLSDHSGTIYPSLAAVALGAKVIEVHVTLSRESYGVDVPASITTAELKQLCEGVAFIETAMQHPIDKDAKAAELDGERKVFGKSIVADCDIARGMTIEAADLTTRKGIPAAKLYEVIGKRATRFIGEGEFLREGDFA